VSVRVGAEGHVERVVGLAAQIGAELVGRRWRGVASGPVEASGEPLRSAALKHGKGHFF